MTVSRRVRFEILRRDGHTCRYCGAAAPDVKLTVDHVIPVALGGGDEPQNLVTACADCNSGKSSTMPDQAIVEDVDATALLFGKAVERAAQQRRLQAEKVRILVEWFNGEWCEFTYNDKPMPRDTDWEQSIERFFAAGLDGEDLWRLLNVAMKAKVPNVDVWRYFCGCCWREITDRQELARRLIEDGDI